MMSSASFIVDFIVALLLSFAVSTSLGVHLPTQHSTTHPTRPRLVLDFVTSRVGDNVDPAWYKLRGGADIYLLDEPIAELGLVEDPTPSIDDNELLYATIGVINVPTSHGDNCILLCYKSNDSSNIQISEKWSVESPVIDDVTNDFALTENTGCLCHGIVLNIPHRIWESGTEPTTSPVINSKQLDDVLLCLVKGIIRRSEGNQHMTIPMAITLEGANALAKEIAIKYVQDFMTRAFYHLRLSKNAVGDDSVGDSSLQHCNVVVRCSDTSAMETAARIASTMLQQSTADEMRRHNVVSRLLFGPLCNQLYHEIRTSLRISSGDHDADVLVEWKKLSEYSSDIVSNDNQADSFNSMVKPNNEKCATEQMQSYHTEQRVSIDLRRKVESVMAMAFVDAEESMLSLENRIDNTILEFDGDERTEDYPPPEFGRDADSIVDAMSSSFTAMLDADDLTESERAWVNDQRTQALKQLVGTGIHRLFHLHLQSLRDYFGHNYECMLDNSMDIDTPNWNLRRRKAARHAEEQFTKAAIGSIPQICRGPEGDFCDAFAEMFSCAEALRGLLEDMEEVTATRDVEESEWSDMMGGHEEESNEDIESRALPHSRIGLRQLIKNVRAKVQRRGPARWYERWAAKAFVIGVNYMQGWLVLQALRREAKKRDMEMPKFPLF